MASLYGYEVETELPLERLNRGAGERGTLRVGPAAEPLVRPPGPPSGELVDESGVSWYESFEFDGRCQLHLPPTGSFLLVPEEPAIVVDRSGGDDDAELLEHRIASAAVCTLLAMRGDLVLHACAVQRSESCVVFCGPSGRGKSTLALALGEAGMPVLAEDGVAIDLDAAGGPLAYPGARGVRRRGPRGRRSETRLAADPASEPGPARVAAVVLLGERGDGLEVAPLGAATATAALTTHLVHSGGRESIAAAFARLARLLGAVPAFTCSLPDDLAALPTAAVEALDRVQGRS
jgi:hypothetical protein